MDGSAPEGTPTPSEEVDILYVQGTTDGLVDFSCAWPQADSVVASFGLAEQGMMQSDGMHRWHRYANAGGTELQFIEHDYQNPNFILRGHCFPGSTDPGFGCSPAAFHTDRS